jgi:hypothetical protein
MYFLWYIVQQEKLRILHEKFKEEVNKQFQDCSNSLEDFESYHEELKVAAEKQSKFNTMSNTWCNAVKRFYLMEHFKPFSKTLKYVILVNIGSGEVSETLVSYSYC